MYMCVCVFVCVCVCIHPHSQLEYKIPCEGIKYYLMLRIRCNSGTSHSRSVSVAAMLVNVLFVMIIGLEYMENTMVQGVKLSFNFCFGKSKRKTRKNILIMSYFCGHI